MPDFKKSKIYKIECRKTGLKYIGSTTGAISRRLAQHKHRISSEVENQYSCCEIIKNGDYFIDILEECPCDTKRELLLRERYWFERTDCVNRQVPSRTKEEYRLQNREKHNEYCRNYYQSNKERLNKEGSERRRQRKSGYSSNGSDSSEVRL